MEIGVKVQRHEGEIEKFQKFLLKVIEHENRVWKINTQISKDHDFLTSTEYMKDLNS